MTAANNGTNNPGASGTGATFSYTDTGRVNVGDQELISVTALNF